VLRIVQPATLLRWHRAGLRALWRGRSRTRSRARLAPETAALIGSMASANRLWGAERIRGELLNLGIRVSKRTIQRYMRAARPHGPRGQRWATLLRNYGHDIWACDFLQAYNVFFRSIYAFVFLQLSTRRIVHVATTRFPTQAWVTQQLRNATALGVAPRFLIRDRDDKFGTAFDALAHATGIRVIRTAPRAPNMNPVAERLSWFAASRAPRPRSRAQRPALRPGCPRVRPLSRRRSPSSRPRPADPCRCPSHGHREHRRAPGPWRPSL
jgi:hypothetical protein